uniref:Uncharacterized protein n=1 Tax=Tanacetum cinerariifolium TaxID=118510 RepID=A0A6L2NMA8_TANCI|nr:hypothetical protein [Tanacetum cinerariifolium]
MEDHDHPIITTIEIPHGLHQGRNFLQYFGGREGSDDSMLEQIDIPDILHLQRRFLESHGCLILTVRYVVNTDEFMTPILERWSIRSNVWSSGLGEREKDSFLVINISGKVVKYNLISKTISQIFYIGSNQMDDDYEFFPPYTVAHNTYDFILSFASV